MSRLPKWTEEQQEYLDKIRKKNSFNRLVHWITERERVRLAKEANQPAPWTKDPILQNYRFCNVRRMDDKVSKWLLDNWYRPYRVYPDKDKNGFKLSQMLVATALARFINLPEALNELTECVFDPKYRLQKRKERGENTFNGAYMVRGNTKISPDKITTVVDEYVGALTKAKIQVNTEWMSLTHQRLCAVYGFGSFMAGQVVADLRWAVDGTWLDRNDWAPKGPGSTKGMNIILNRPENNPITQEEFLSNLVSLIAKLKTVLNPSITKRLEAHDYQNCLCELSKYNRTLQGEGTPKQLYSSGNL
jgi:alpha-glutamyl/putrescinyl thymine pyrophosphorylase clade 1